MAKIKMNLSETVSETFEYFLISKRASGLSDKTLYTYKQHFKAIGKIIDVEISIDELNGNHLEFLISSMREKIVCKFNK